MAKQKLAPYRAKRDFTKTGEPSGKLAIAAADYPRFIIQKHDASRLHYDLRLEVDGVFKSWAVTKGPSLDPKNNRLAVEVEHHPLDYGDFEGTIPKGEYGGGTVMLWDRGFWSPENGHPLRAFKRGELKFTIFGEKLKGSFVLVRMRSDRNGGKRSNWLLIKHRDEFAQDREASITDQVLSIASGRTMEQIAEGKGREPTTFMAGGSKRSGKDAVWHSNKGEASAPTATSAKKKKLKASESQTPPFIAPQLCKIVQRAPSGDDWVHEIKFDGYRMQLRLEDGIATLRTRKGLDWTEKFSAIADAASSLRDGIIDGEVVALDHNGAPDFAALQAAISEGRSRDLIYFAFDLLFEGDEDLRDAPLSERKTRLEKFLSRKGKHSNQIRYVAHLNEAGDAVLKSACQMNLEGIVSKRSNAPYRSGRTDSWVKAKCRAGHEVVIGGWSGSGSHLRSLLVGVRKGDHLVHTGRVGTGFNSRNSGELFGKLKKLATDKSRLAARKLRAAQLT